MKSVTMRYAPLLVTLVIGFAAGWLIRGVDGTAAHESPQNSRQSRREIRPSPVATASTAPAGASAGVWDPSVEWAKLPAETRAATLRDMLALPEGDARMARFIAVLRGLDRGDVAVAVRAIKEGDRRGITYSKEWEALVAHWGRIAGPEAVKTAFDSFGIEHKDKAWFSKVAVRGWAEVDPQAAISWINANPDHSDWPGCVRSIASGVGQRDPALAAALMVKTLAGSGLPGQVPWVRDQVAQELAGRAAAAGGLAGLENWLTSIPTDDDGGAMRKLAFSHTAKRMVNVSDEDAQAFFTRFAGDPLRDEKAYAGFTARLAERRSPREALEWAAALPRPAGGAEAVFNQWQQNAPQDAAAWRAALPESDFKSSLGE